MVVEAKLRERGEAALNARDRIHRRQMTMLNADRCLLLQPGPERSTHLAIDMTDPGAVLRLIVDRDLKGQGSGIQNGHDSEMLSYGIGDERISRWHESPPG